MRTGYRYQSRTVNQRSAWALLLRKQNDYREQRKTRKADLAPKTSATIQIEYLIFEKAKFDSSTPCANNSRLAEEEGVARATSKVRRVMEERAERERFRREMNRRENEIREQRERERMEREEREMVTASSWSQQQEAISGLEDKITRNIICGNCGRQKYGSKSSLVSTDCSNGLSTPVLEQCVLDACPLAEAGVLRDRGEREQFESEIERKEREIRQQRARKRRERKARELAEEASRWPQQQEAINGPWCACRLEGEETAQGSEQGVETLPEPQQET